MNKIYKPIDMQTEHKKLEIEENFIEWMNDGNVLKIGKDEYIEQTTQWRKKFTLDELKHFYIREFEI